MKCVLFFSAFLCLANGIAQQDSLVEKYQSGKIKRVTTTDTSNHICKTISYNEEGAYLKTDMTVVKDQHKFTLLQLEPDMRPDSNCSLAGNYYFKLTFEGTSIFREFLLTLYPDNTFHLYMYAYESCYNYIQQETGSWKLKKKEIQLIQSNYIPNKLSVNSDNLISNSLREIDGKMRVYEFKKIHP